MLQVVAVLMLGQAANLQGPGELQKVSVAALPQPGPLLVKSASAFFVDPGNTPPVNTRESFDDIVAVGNDEEFYCSGVLVAPNLVLTARHCPAPSRVAWGASLSGVHEELRVTEVRPHPRLDVSLLVLERAMKQSRHPRRRAVDAQPPEGQLFLVGFGTTARGGPASYGVRRIAQVRAQGWGCSPSRSDFLGCDPESELIITSASGADTCPGDSGGGVFERRNGKWTLVAVTNRGLWPGRCGRGGVYVRVDVLDDWLSQFETAEGASE